MRCEVKGCKADARWTARKLWGTGGSLAVCDEHRPDPANRPDSLKHLPFFYEVAPIDEAARTEY
jgi:hypothetical protein